MTAYYLKLAWLSVRKNPLLTSLMIGAIALGIGVSMTTLTLYHVMSSDPLPQKSDRVFAVQLDTWNPDDPYYERDEGSAPPPQTTFRDSMALMESDIPTHQAVMLHRGFAARLDEDGARPERLSTRATYGDFFPMFDVPFLFGSGWDRNADSRAERVVVLSKRINDKFFGGKDSVGERLMLDGSPFTVVGVIDEWRPIPHFYDLNGGDFDDSEELFVPFQVPISLEYHADGSTNCWKPERIESYQDFLQSECVWLQHWAQLDSDAQRDEFQAFIEAYALEQRKLGRFGRPLDNRLSDIMTWLEFREVVSDDNRLLMVLAFMFLAICLLNTIGLMLAKFINRAPLVGVRRALGASRFDIIRQHGVEVLIIGIMGGLAGLVLSWAGLIAVRSWYRGYEYLAHLDPAMVVSAIGLAVFSAALAGLYPTWRISRIQPAVHLKAQ
ncbi:MAG: ABC transporter permease [Pseudomonadota bacterium]